MLGTKWKHHISEVCSKVEQLISNGVSITLVTSDSVSVAGIAGILCSSVFIEMCSGCEVTSSLPLPAQWACRVE